MRATCVMFAPPVLAGRPLLRHAVAGVRRASLGWMFCRGGPWVRNMNLLIGVGRGGWVLLQVVPILAQACHL